MPRTAARGGFFEVFKWLKETGCPLDCLCCIHAARRGNLEMLKWLKENGCFVDPERYNVVTHNATREGHLEVMKWVHSIGCFLNVCTSEAKCLEILN